MKKILLSLFVMLLVSSSVFGFTGSADVAKAESSSVKQTNITSGNEGTSLITPFANEQGGGGEVKFIYVDKYIKNQGYLNNTQLKDYVKYVKSRVNGMTVLTATLGWLTLNSAIGSTMGTISAGSIFANFDDISNKAAQGYGMGWVNMYSTGTQSLTIIPRRDFSKIKTLYVKN